MCIWIKDNIQNNMGPRLSWVYELFHMGFHNPQGISTNELYNFREGEEHNNVVTFSTASNKLLYSATGGLVNPYQKPLKLISWLVEHFSRPGDWVLDLCAGTGTTAVAALLAGQNVVSIELSRKQADFIKKRLTSLEDRDEEAVCELETTGHQTFEVGKPVGGTPTKYKVRAVLEVLTEVVGRKKWRRTSLTRMSTITTMRTMTRTTQMMMEPVLKLVSHHLEAVDVVQNKVLLHLPFWRPQMSILGMSDGKLEAASSPFFFCFLSFSVFRPQIMS